MTVGTWLEADVGAIASEKILDAAGKLFAERGGARTNMAEIAGAAGCSRATLYRYFDSRDTLRNAYVAREARRIGQLVSDDVATISDARIRAAEAVLAAIQRVRSEPSLNAWFVAELAGVGPAMSQSAAIESIVAGSLGDPTDPSVGLRARWAVRVIVSFLAMPAASEAEERHMVESFVVPALAQ